MQSSSGTPETSRVFISYSTQDASTAALVVSTLGRLKLDIFFDRLAIAPGDGIVGAINQALANTHYVLLIWSASAARSPWVEREVEAAVWQEIQGGLALITIRLDDTPLPPLLAARKYFSRLPSLDALLGGLERFFLDELARPRDRRVRGWQAPATNPLANASRRDIRLVALRCMQEQDFQGFLFEHKLDHNRVAGATFGERLMWLLHEVDTNLGLEVFVEWINAERGPCVRRHLTPPPPES
jgi:hypothetical protein